MFATTGILNESVLREMRRYVLPPKQKMMMYIMALLLIVGGIVSYAVFHNQFSAVLSLAIGIYLVFHTQKMAENAIRMNIKNIRANCGENACSYTTSFSDEGILVHNLATGTKVRYKYEGVVSMKESASLYALFTKSHQMICIFKQDLKEDPQELKAYLREKPTQIKW